MKQDKKFANEISKIFNLPILVLSSNAHNGLDYIHSLLDSHDQIVILPAFSYFRFIDREKIGQDLFKNKKKLIKLIANILFKKKSYNVPRRKFFRNKKEKKIFAQHLSNFFYKYEINHKNLFYGIHYAFLKIKKDNFFLKKMIISHEHMIWNNEKYFIFDNIKFSFVIRDPRAAIAGSILQMKKINQDNFLESHQMDKILINFITGWNFIKNQKRYNHKNLYFFINEKFNKNLKLEMKKFCRWSGLTFKPKMLVSTFNNKNWSGESSYLMKNKIDLNKKVSKNFYNSNNVRKRWLRAISVKEIKTIESFSFDYMRAFKYQAIYIRSNFQKIINLYRIFHFYTLPRLTLEKSRILQYLKNIIKRSLVVLLTKKSIKVLSIK